jgi:hypothetical protein
MFGGANNVSNMIGYTDPNDPSLTDLSGAPSYSTGWTVDENIGDFIVMDQDFVGAGYYEECVNAPSPPLFPSSLSHALECE